MIRHVHLFQDRSPTYLLYASNVPCNVFNSYWVLHRKAMVLALYSCFINQDSTIRRQPWGKIRYLRKKGSRELRTSKREADMVI